MKTFEEIEEHLNRVLVHMQHIYRGMGQLQNEQLEYMACINMLLDELDLYRERIDMPPFNKRLGVRE